jgi:MYXO-CTERM domain-containing protein
VAEGTSCSDGKFCNGNEACDNQGNCIAGTPPDCTSSDPCVTKQCDEAQQTCAITANVGVKCSDGNACTVGDACDANGKCTSNGNKNCNDGKTCTADTCDPATGDCVYKPVTDGFQCDDGVACTTGETCRNGQCIAAGTVSCDDNNICTQDILDCQTSQCSHAPVVGTVACVPTDKCFYNGECSQGSCVGKTPVNCDDGNPCTKDSCDPASGCVHANEPVTTVCSDGNPCTADDRCRVTGKCVGTPITCAAIDDCHLPGICDEATGRCGTDPRRDDGAFCANGNGRCLNGSCRMLPTGAAGATGVAGAPNAGGNEGQAGSAGALTDVAGAAGTLGNAGNAGTAGAADIGGSSAVALGGATASPALGGGSGNPTSLAALGGNPSSRSVDDKDVYHRNPGGCSCSVPNHSSRNGLAALMVLGLAWVVRRRRPIG